MTPTGQATSLKVCHRAGRLDRERQSSLQVTVTVTATLDVDAPTYSNEAPQHVQDAMAVATSQVRERSLASRVRAMAGRGPTIDLASAIIVEERASCIISRTTAQHVMEVVLWHSILENELDNVH